MESEQYDQQGWKAKTLLYLESFTELVHRLHTNKLQLRLRNVTLRYTRGNKSEKELWGGKGGNSSCVLTEICLIA